MKHVIITHINNKSVIRTLNGSGDVEYDHRSPEELLEYYTTEFLSLRESKIVWVSDLRLYGESIIQSLYYIGYKDVTSEDLSIKKMPSKSFKYVVAIKGNVYAIYVRVGRKTMYIYNTDNILANLPADEICKAWGGDPNKLEDLSDAIYKGIYNIGGFQERKTPYTISMVAMRKWKTLEDLYFCENLTDCKNYKAPGDYKGNLADYIRESYQAGWNYLNNIERSKYRNVHGYVYDINSSYPYVMATKPIPWGDPIEFIGEIPSEIKDDDRYYYYVRVKLQFDLKEGNHFPYLRKRGDFRYKLRDYLETSDIIKEKGGKKYKVKSIINLDGKREEVFPEFILSKTDYELIHRHYDIRKEEVIDGVYYRTCRNVFKHFVNYYYSEKKDAKDPGKRRIAKMIQNAVSGSLAKRTERANVIYEEEDGELNVYISKSESPSKCYIHMASAILSYAREIVYEAACENYDHFIYCDTDSLHLYGGEAQGIDISDTKLGSWKLEREFEDAIYFKRKTYVLKLKNGEKDHYHVVMSGLTDDYKRMIEDILDAESPNIWKTTADLYYGKYGSARNLVRYSVNQEYDKMLGRAISSRTKDFYKLKEFIEEISKAEDRMAILSYIEYPNGIDECDNFDISHMSRWMAIKN